MARAGALQPLPPVHEEHLERRRRRRRSPGRTVVRIGAALLGVVVSAIALLVVAVVVLAVSRNHGVNSSLPPLEPSSYGMNVALSPDGATAYVTEPTADALAVVDTGTGSEEAHVPVGLGPAGLAVSPGGGQVWVADADAAGDGVQTSVTVVSAATDTVVGTISGLGAISGAIDVAFAPGGGTAYVSENGGLSDGGVAVVDAATLQVVGQLVPSLGTQWNPTSVAVSPDGQQVWVSAEPSPISIKPGSVFVFSAATGDELAQVRVGAAPDFLALSPDGRYAYVAAKVGCRIEEIDAATFRVVTSVVAPSGFGCPFGVAAGKEDGTVYAVTGNDHFFDQGRQGDAFEVYSLASGAVSVHRITGADPVTVAMSPDGATAYVVDADHPTIDVVSAATGAVMTKVPLAGLPAATSTAAGGG